MMNGREHASVTAALQHGRTGGATLSELAAAFEVAHRHQMHQTMAELRHLIHHYTRAPAYDQHRAATWGGAIVMGLVTGLLSTLAFKHLK
jgi:hypothetical protein